MDFTSIIAGLLQIQKDLKTHKVIGIMELRGIALEAGFEIDRACGIAISDAQLIMVAGFAGVDVAYKPGPGQYDYYEADATAVSYTRKRPSVWKERGE